MSPKPNTATVAGNFHGKFDEVTKRECDAENCLEAKAKLLALRNQITLLCARMKQKNSLRTMYTALAAAFLAIAAGLFAAASAAAATIIGIPVAAILMVEALAASAMATTFLVLALAAGIEANNIGTQIYNMQGEWNNLAMNVMVNCPEKCWPDLEFPTCK